MHRNRIGRLTVFLAGMSLLAACQEEGAFSFLNSPPADEAGNGAATRLVERDVEAPEVFQVTEPGLWDGRPSLGGVWIAYPGVTDPERVIIRNTANEKFVIGALFRRERENPGPKLQVSSDAAAALGLLAGQPTKLNVTALRREEVPEEAPETPAEETDQAAAPAAEIESKPLADAAAAIDKAEAEQKAAAPAKPAAAPKPKASSLSKPYIQIGIFSVEANATRTGDALRKAGVVPTIHDQESRGKRFWRVVVGPASTGSERAQLLKKVKGLGFTDAYFVTN